MNLEDQIHNVEITIEQAKEQVAIADALQRLHKNADFKKLILEGYFKDEPARLVGLLADPHMAGDREQQALNASLRAISELRQYFGMKFHFGELAQKAIEDGKEALEQIHDEQVNGPAVEE